ncbi:hypothetical protein NM208_g2535 [Fusarium decemcellulare]|uniref:Uncharacterized protein n=2 Tax=Fusarium decemcellulare TaxID=57161 RepID=A0ACC1SSC3_9HYPO|nr:hypothetical protein NM208_g3525 [Fusarium decemcellulare]KAJ3545372.1 hypothetical protein NM208_g2535 [Fusarium decemcellulare]
MQQTLALGLFALAPLLAEAASKTKWATETVFLPPRSTGKASNIYASVITEEESKTEYLLACQTNFGASYTCDGDFKGITVTYTKSDMDIAFGATTYDCELGSSAVCATKTKSSDDEKTTTLDASESSSWMTAVTLVDVSKSKKRKTDSADAASTSSSDSKLCKRKTHGSSSSDSSSDSGSSSSSSGTKSGTKSNNNNDNDCSAASTFSWNWSILALFLGAFAIFNMR